MSTGPGSVGFVMLAHARLDRAGAVARHLSAQGAPVVVHLDPRGAGAEALAAPDVTVIAEHEADWGRFGLVAATLAGVERLLADQPDLGHVCLISGSCLPLRPVADLQGFLAGAGDKDFIESVPVSKDQWVEDGLSLERFTLYHPFSHRHQPWWFSRCVDIQRAIGVRRRLPVGVDPHLGGQWWCLSTRSLRAILGHADRKSWEKFFQSTWIPDESFFQTLVRTVRTGDEPGPPLHFGRFNRRGRPIVFHDDHADYLAGTDHFFARKIDPDAGALYDRYLSVRAPSQRRGFVGEVDEAPLARARGQVDDEGRGTLGPGRLPKGTTLTRCDTARPYLAVIGEDADLLEAIWPRLQAEAPAHLVHGRLFRADAPAAFCCGSMTYKGNLSGQPYLRDYRAAQFLSRLIWADRDRPVVFLLGPGDETEIRYQLATDTHARLVVLGVPGASGEVLGRLARPFGGRGKGVRTPMPQRAWHQSVDGAAVREDLQDRGDGSGIQTLLDIITGDWSRPDGWSIPE